MKLICLFLLFIIYSKLNSFNLDIQNSVEFQPKLTTNLSQHLNKLNTINFGISLAMLKMNEDEFSIFIGAPNSDGLLNNEPKSTGQLFYCEFSSKNFSSKQIECLPSNLILGTDQTIVQTSYMQFSNALSATNRQIVICASGTLNDKLKNHYYPNGACYYNFLQNSTYSPRNSVKFLLKNEYDYFDLNGFIKLDAASNVNKQIYYNTYFYSHAMLGFSVQAYKKNERLLVIGAPGYNEWSGAVLQYKFYNNENKLINLYNIGFSSYLYFGYAVTLGRFFNDGQIYCASSAPKFKSFGAVFVFKLNKKSVLNRINEVRLKNVETLHGQSNGEYFGYSIQALDLNNDGYDDLIVGAPFFSISMKERSDNGIVYIFISDGNTFNDPQTVYGSSKVNAMFGYNLAVIDDLDQDEIQDFAVGAPYEDESSGCVYIFNGHKDSVIIQHSQKICAKDFELNKYLGFGNSLLGTLDISRNGYPGLLIGSYLTSNVVYLRAKPVIRTMAYFKFNLTSIDLSANNSLCRNKKSQKLHICLKLSYCSKIISPHPTEQFLISKLQLDEKYSNRDSRAYFELNSIITNSTATSNSIIFRSRFKSNVLICYSSFLIMIKKKIKDKISPIIVSASHKLDTSNLTFHKLDKVILINEDKKFISLINFYTGCTLNERCIADFKLSMKVFYEDELRKKKLQYLVLGKQRLIELIVEVENQGENAYLSYLSLNLSLGLIAKKIESKCIMNNLFEPNKTFNSNFRTSYLNINCNLGNPFEKGRKIFKFIFELNILDLVDQRTVLIRSNLSTIGNVTKTSILSQEIHIPIQRFASIFLRQNQVNNVVLIENRNKANLNMLTFTNLIQIAKNGFSPIQQIELLIQVPTHYLGLLPDQNLITDIKIENLDGGKIFCEIYKNNRELGEDWFKYRNNDGMMHKMNSNQTNENNRLYHEVDLLTQLDSDSFNSNSKREKTLHLNCNNLECTTYQCVIGPLALGKQIFSFNLIGNLSLGLVDKVFDFNYSKISLQTNVQASILDKEFYSNEDLLEMDLENRDLFFSSTKLSTIFRRLPSNEKFSLWIFITGIFIGLILILIIVYLLVKVSTLHFENKEINKLHCSPKREQRL